MTHRRWELLYWMEQGVPALVRRCLGRVVQRLEVDEQLGQVERVSCSRCAWTIRVWRPTQEQHKQLTTT